MMSNTGLIVGVVMACLAVLLLGAGLMMRRTKSRSKSKPGSKRGFHRKSSCSAVVLDSSTGFHRSADSSGRNRDDGSNMALSGGIGMAISTRGSGRHRMLHEDDLSRSMPSNTSTNALQLLEQGL